jgi:hypothetical protein
MADLVTSINMAKKKSSSGNLMMATCQALAMSRIQLEKSYFRGSSEMAFARAMELRSTRMMKNTKESGKRARSQETEYTDGEKLLRLKSKHGRMAKESLKAKI